MIFDRQYRVVVEGANLEYTKTFLKAKKDVREAFKEAKLSFAAGKYDTCIGQLKNTIRIIDDSIKQVNSIPSTILSNIISYPLYFAKIQSDIVFGFIPGLFGIEYSMGSDISEVANNIVAVSTKYGPLARIIQILFGSYSRLKEYINTYQNHDNVEPSAKPNKMRSEIVFNLKECKAVMEYYIKYVNDCKAKAKEKES